MTRPDPTSTTFKTQAARTRLANKARREALRETLEGGAVIFPDTKPGIGWVLLRPNGRKSYMKDREGCVALWFEKYKAIEAEEAQAA